VAQGKGLGWRDGPTGTTGEFTINLSKSGPEEHSNAEAKSAPFWDPSSSRVFNSYLGFVNQAYLGPLGASQVPLTSKNSQARAGNPEESANPVSQQIKQLIQSSSATHSITGGPRSGSRQQKSTYQATFFDMLMNPLRSEHPFEDWSPKEIQIFQNCILMYDKSFGHFLKHLKRKSL